MLYDIQISVASYPTVNLSQKAYERMAEFLEWYQPCVLGTSNPRKGTAMSRKVLVIDEDDTYREGVAVQLREVGYEVIETGSNVKGLLKALFEIPDLILMDLKLSDIYGFQAIRWLKTTPKTKDIPVIIYTSSHEEDQRQKALRVGAAIVLTKPGSRVILRMLVQKLSQPESQRESYIPGNNGRAWTQPVAT